MEPIRWRTGARFVRRAAASGSGREARLSELDAFLIDYIHANPKIRFGRIVDAARAERNIPRTTAARHLARLVRWGEVTLLPDRTYIAEDTDQPGARAVVEVRWYNVVVIIRPNGNARIISDEEIRLSAGRLDHIEFNHPKPPRQFLIWTTVPGTLTRRAAAANPSGLSAHRVEFLTPLTARDRTWHRVCVSVEWPRWYRMSRPAGRASGSRSPTNLATELQSVEVASLGRRFERRLAPDARVRLQVILPDGYPAGRLRPQVRYHAETERSDVAEEHRIRQLGRRENGLEGLHRYGTTFTLSVPQPLLDRHYTIEWKLPTSGEYRRWLTRARRLQTA